MTVGAIRGLTAQELADRHGISAEALRESVAAGILAERENETFCWTERAERRFGRAFRQMGAGS